MPVLIETVHHASGTYAKGDVLPADHPLVIDGPHLFEPSDVAPEVEVVSAKRGPGRPRKDV